MAELELSNKWMVCVRCFTYNQSRYITDAMDGFVMQQTNFPFVCCIVDDASTDGEQEVIRNYLREHFDLQDASVAYEKDEEYGSVTFARHKTNESCFFAVLYLKENHRSQKKSKIPYLSEWSDYCKNIAICEGDDYWTDSLKLQKQVDFLEGHKDYIMCSHNYIKYYENTKAFEDHPWYYYCFKDNESQIISYSLDEYFMRWWTQPLTCLYRNGKYLQNIPRTKYKYFRDDVFYYYVLKEGKGALFSDVMGVYRINDGGIWQGKHVVTQYKAGRDNALAIYNNENDERALCKASRDEMGIVVDFWSEQHRWKALKEVASYKRLVPRAEYRRFLRSVYEWLSGKMKRKMKVVFKA